jgi:hypothetical protein
MLLAKNSVVFRDVCAGGRVVVMKEPVVVAPKFRPVFFVAHLLSSVSKRHTKSPS